MPCLPAWVALAWLAGWLAVAPAAAQSGGLQFGETATNIIITGYTGAGGSVAIPEMIREKPVTAIGEGAFSGCAQLTNLVVAGSVTTVGARAFYYCTGLAGLALPASVASVVDRTIESSIRKTRFLARTAGSGVYLPLALRGRTISGWKRLRASIWR